MWKYVILVVLVFFRSKLVVKLVFVIFFDCDGIINVDYGYVYEIDNFEFIDGVIDVMCELKEMGYVLVLVINQFGIVCGKFIEVQFEMLIEWMDWFLVDCGVDFDGIYYCLYYLQGVVEEYCQICDCCKLYLGMLIFVCDYLYIDMVVFYMVGDKLEDMQVVVVVDVGIKVLVCIGKFLIEEVEKVVDWVLNSLVELLVVIKKQ